MYNIPRELPVKTAKDLVQPAKRETLHATPVEVPAIPELVPVITWAEVIAAYINTRLRSYVIDTVTGQIIVAKTRFWIGFVSGVVSVLLLGFVVWQIVKVF